MIRRHILLVDDEQAFTETLAQRLRRRGFIVDTALGGKEALAFLRRDGGDHDDNDIDVVVLDVRMPEMDGIEALRAIKKESLVVEVIMLTGYADVGQAIAAVKLGAFDYLMKPCDIDVFVAKISAAARKKEEHASRILKVRMKPYISDREKEELIEKAGQ